MVNKNVDINISVHDAFLEYPSPRSKPKYWEQETQQDINRTKSTKVTMPRGGEP